MPDQKYPLTLTEQERSQLECLCRSTRRSPREKTRARILLLTDTKREGEPLNDAKIAKQLHCAPLTVAKLREKAALRGAVAATLHKAQTRRKARALDGEKEAHLVALCCSTPPKGRSRWTLNLLKKRLIELEIVENIGCETIRRTMKKTNLSPG